MYSHMCIETYKGWDIMPFKRYFNISTDNLYYNGSYLKRRRLHELMESAMNYPVVAICAGAGHGKTHTAYSFFREYPANLTWLQLSGRDNAETRFWENYANTVAQSFPKFGERFLNIGFPDTEDAFAEFEAVLRDSRSYPGKYITVFDDFHLLHNDAILRFINRVVGVIQPNGAMVLISRTVPEIDFIGMMLHERIFTIHEDSLCFTKDEIGEYFCQISLPAAMQDIKDIYDDTRGWAFAVNLLGRSLHENPKYKRFALEAMKSNIFKLIESEISQTVSEPLWNFLLRISLIDHLAASLINSLAGDEALLKEMELLNAYIRYDIYLDAYMIHHLFLDYLRRSQHMLADGEKRDIYEKAGAWCENNNYQADALSYYDKAGNYDAIMRIVNSFYMHMPQDITGYALEVLDRLPEDAAFENPLFPVVSLKLRINLGLLEEADALAKRYAGHYEALAESAENNRILSGIYGYWGLCRLFMCPRSDVYDFDRYFEKLGEYYEKSPFAMPALHAGRSPSAWALIVGSSRAGAPDEYTEAMTRSIPHISRALDGRMYGFDDLIRGELHYLRWKMRDAEMFLRQALSKAQERGQYDIQSGAIIYLMRIALSGGYFDKAGEMLQAIRELHENPDYTIRKSIFDIACGLYYMTLDHSEAVPDWLKGGFESYANPAPQDNVANYIKAQYHYKTRQFSALLAFIEKELERQQRLLGKIELKTAQSLSLYQIKRRDDAFAALAEAYDLAAPNNIIAPFIQYAKDMRTLTYAAIRSGKSPIPILWLENINRKSSALAKRHMHMINKYKADNHIGNEISLTAREIEVLRDLSQGLTRTEIAASQNISLNTVKMLINTIYDKLCVNNLAEAIRVAVENQMV